MWCGSDNVAAVSWCTRGSTSSKAPQAHLLHWLAQITRNHLCSLHTMHVPGSTNTLADFCSRSFHHTDQEFLTQLATQYPIAPSWTLAPVTCDMTSKLSWTLSSMMLPWESLTSKPRPLTPPGSSGNASAPNWTSTQPYRTPQTASSLFNSSPIVTIGAKYLPAKLLSVVKWWEMPFVPLARRWPTWATLTLDFSHLANYNFD
jgi:hypothetical protein